MSGDIRAFRGLLWAILFTLIATVATCAACRVGYVIGQWLGGLIWR